MPTSDQDEPPRSRRRRAKSGADEGGFDDFWADAGSGRGRGRRRPDSPPAGDPSGVAHLREPAPGPPAGRPDLPRREPRPPVLPRREPGRAAGGPGRPPVGDPAARPPVGPPMTDPRGTPVGPRGTLPQRSAAGYAAGRAGRIAAGPPAGRGGSYPPADPTPYAPAADPTRYAPAADPPYVPATMASGGTFPPGRSGGPMRATGAPAWSDPRADFGDDGYGDEYYDDEDDDGDDLPRRRGCRAVLIVLAVIVVMALVAGWFGWSWVQDKIDPPGSPGEAVMVEIPEGTSTAGIGDVLADAGVITDARVWGVYTRLQDVGSFQAGTYRMRLNSSFDEAVDDLEKEPLPPNSRLVTVPEGFTLTQTLARLADPEKGVPGFTVEGLQAALADPASRSPFIPADKPLEGSLFPETYSVEEGDTEAVVVQRMVTQFNEVMTELDANGRAAALGITPYDVLIVASLIEEEARVPEDRPMVARVIYNRIAAGEPLGIDATLCYEKGQIPCDLTDADLDADTPYNTRVRPGLTPTPLASPGRASIEAALSPTEGPWKWYVLSDAEGHHTFTDDYDEFVRLKAECAEKGLGCG
jgi:peptidoglycan lytic transglycosylase G